MRRSYLDHNATTPPHPDAIAAMEGVLREDFGNPSSVHGEGARAREVLERARGQVAELLGVEPDTIVFTSSATEANNTVLRSAEARAPQHGDRIVTCSTEHPSILELVDELRSAGLGVTVLPVASDGSLDPEVFARSLDEHTLLASVMWANNETGVIHPIPELARIARERGVPFHTDAVQALGKLPLDLGRLPVDFASFSAHKLGGPKGTGALYTRSGERVAPLLRGGPQEGRRRAGTENVPGIAGFGAACAAAGRELERNAALRRSLRDRLWDGIAAKIPDSHLNAASAERLPHVLNVSFADADSEALVASLDLEGIAVAAGAACASGSLEPSHVLLAMGLPPELGRGSIRFSFGLGNGEQDVDRVIDVLPAVVERVRAELRE